MLATNIAAIIAALVLVESNGRNVTGDGGKAVGVLQTWPVQVREVNRILGTQAYTLEDRRNPEKSKEMAGVFLTYWAPRRNCTRPEEVAGLWRNPCGKRVNWYRKRFLRYYEEITRR